MRCARYFPAGLVLVTVVVAGCKGSGEPQEEPDQTTEAAVEGLPREEIQDRARPMSPEQAEALGIVDSTTHLEIPPVADTLLPMPADTVVPRDTSR